MMITPAAFASDENQKAATVHMGVLVRILHQNQCQHYLYIITALR